MSEVSVNFIGGLVMRCPFLEPILRAHLADNFDEVLPHVFFGDLTRYVIREFSRLEGEWDCEGDEPSGQLQDLLEELERAFVEGGGEISELIAVSFLENLPSPGENGQELRNLLGPGLKSEFERPA
jgi:hypothetical protein